MGVLTDTLRSTLRDLAESDARLYRGLAEELGIAPRRQTLPPAEVAAAIALLQGLGYAITPPQG